MSMQGYRQKDHFIATQGPLAHTVEDFWRMVWEWRCHTVVMLTEVQEREQVSSWDQGAARGGLGGAVGMGPELERPCSSLGSSFRALHTMPRADLDTPVSPGPTRAQGPEDHPVCTKAQLRAPVSTDLPITHQDLRALNIPGSCWSRCWGFL